MGRIVRRQFYVHKIQKKNLLFGAVLIFAYTIILIASVLLTPDLSPLLNESGEPVGRFIVLLKRYWPAFAISFIASLLFGLFLTRRLAGPLYRFEQTIKAILKGDLSIRIRLREKDEFQDLALLLNQAIVEIDQRLRAIERKGHQLEDRLSQVLIELKRQPQGEVVAQQLEPLYDLHSELMVLIKRFQMSSSLLDLSPSERSRSESGVRPVGNKPS